LIKPTCDGSLTVDLAAVLPEVLSVAEERPEAAVLAQRIDSLVRYPVPRSNCKWLETRG